jgi:hypothetical protein
MSWRSSLLMPTSSRPCGQGSKPCRRPVDLQIPIPKSAWEAHRRMEAIARFHADPEIFIRRQAQRIAKARAKRVQSLDLDPAEPADFSSSGSARSGGGGGASTQSRHSGPAIRAPPGTDVFLCKPATPDPKALPREREPMPETSTTAAYRSRGRHIRLPTGPHTLVTASCRHCSPIGGEDALGTGPAASGYGRSACELTALAPVSQGNTSLRQARNTGVLFACSPL